MIINWLKRKGEQDKQPKQLHLGLLGIFSAFIGGYMVSDFPHEFLSLFTTVQGQLLVFMILNTITEYHETEFNIVDVMIEALISVIVLQLVKSIVIKAYGRKH
jgi:hypothetical protein